MFVVLTNILFLSPSCMYIVDKQFQLIIKYMYVCMYVCDIRMPGPLRIRICVSRITSAMWPLLSKVA